MGDVVHNDKWPGVGDCFPDTVHKRIEYHDSLKEAAKQLANAQLIYRQLHGKESPEILGVLLNLTLIRGEEDVPARD